MTFSNVFGSEFDVPISTKLLRELHSNFEAAPLASVQTQPLQAHEVAIVISLGHEQFCASKKAQRARPVVFRAGQACPPAKFVDLLDKNGAKLATFDLNLGDFNHKHAVIRALKSNSEAGFDLELTFAVRGENGVLGRAFLSNIDISAISSTFAPLTDQICHFSSSIFSSSGAPLGSIRYSCMVVRGVTHVSANESASSFISAPGRPLILGHRGLGSNKIHANHAIACAENTLLSFALAVDAGADGVELDVLVSADNHLVINHDFTYDRHETEGDGSPVLICETPASTVMASLPRGTLDVYPHNAEIEDRLSGSGDALAAVRASHAPAALERLQPPLRPVTAAKRPLALDLDSAPVRIPGSGSAGGSGSGSAGQPRPAFAEVLHTLPLDAVINIEIKYPAQGPAAGRYPGPGALTAMIIEAVSQAPSRPVIVSSFDPWVCIAAGLLQDRWPVLFLNCATDTDADFPWGDADTRGGDPRVHDLERALAFALEPDHGVAGLVVAVDTLRSQPATVARAARAGRSVLTYGTRTNEAPLIKWQLELGVGGIIYDNIVP